MPKFLKLIIALAIPQIIGALGAIFTTPAIPSWYSTIVKPEFTPLSWIFGPVWTTLFLLMGLSLFLIWKSRVGVEGRRLAYQVFGLQLGLNLLWSLIFFGLQSPGWALVEIALLWLAIVWNIRVFYRLHRVAGLLLVPYLVWVSFASYLNLSIWLLNRI